MSYDTIRVEPNERIDFGDFAYAAVDNLDSIYRRPGEAFYGSDAATIRSWILDGFNLSNPSGKQLMVTRGRAILGARINGQVQYGYLALDGDLTKIIDLAPFPSTTYNVYIRFELVDSDNNTRLFWDPTGSGSEFSQTIATRRKGNWSIRVETTNPGPEWVQIGTADNSGIGLAIVDQRPLYFEGHVNLAYQSGWSSDGGGVANDRDSDRQAYGVKDLQAFTAATRQCLEDIKGRGLRRWWSRDIGGMNIGFDAAPVEDRLAIGDPDMYLQWASDYPTLRMAAGGDDLVYDRANNYWQFKIAGIEEARISAAGLATTNGLYVGDATGIPVDNQIYAEGDIESAAYLRAAGRLYLGSNDYVDWNGTVWKWMLNAVEAGRLQADGLSIAGGLQVGALSTPTPGQISAQGDIGTQGNFYSVGGYLYLNAGGGLNDYIRYVSTSFRFALNAVEAMRLTANGLAITNGLYVGSATGTPTDNNIYAEGYIQAVGDVSGASITGGIITGSSIDVTGDNKGNLFKYHATKTVFVLMSATAGALVGNFSTVNVNVVFSEGCNISVHTPNGWAFPIPTMAGWVLTRLGVYAELLGGNNGPTNFIGRSITITKSSPWTQQLNNVPRAAGSSTGATWLSQSYTGNADGWFVFDAGFTPGLPLTMTANQCNIFTMYGRAAGAADINRIYCMLLEYSITEPLTSGNNHCFS